MSPQCLLTGSAIVVSTLAIGAFAQASPHVPSLTEAQGRIDQFLNQSNTDVQNRLGIYNDHAARRVAEINMQLGGVSAEM